MGPGPLIAIDVVLLYALLGPLVLLGVYVLLESVTGTELSGDNFKVGTGLKADPSLWDFTQVESFFE